MNNLSQEAVSTTSTAPVAPRDARADPAGSGSATSGTMLTPAVLRVLEWHRAQMSSPSTP